MMARPLPAGDVTLMFTDIEGSTRLLRAVGAAAYAELQGIHRRLLRSTAAHEGGVEVDTQGDAFFFVFADAAAAVRAAVAGRDALAAYPWPAGHAIKVRVGMHRGTPVRLADHYVGEDVNRAARIAALGSGGQILCSEELAGSLGDVDERGVLFPVGEFRLKDFELPASLFQVGTERHGPIGGGWVDLPVPRTGFVGRHAELFEALTMWLDRGPRIATITGPGGVGKTRFAIELARLLRDEHPGGTSFAELAPLATADAVPAAIAAALLVTVPPGRAPEDAISERMRLPALLVVDNVEHVLSSGTWLADLLTRTPALRMITTSREPLRVAGEHVIDLPPMDPGAAASLFVERSAAAGGHVSLGPDVELLCRRLDHLPLALELAAARSRSISPTELVAQLDERLDLLVAGPDADPRQRTLVDTVRWSVDLLAPRERRSFGDLAIFSGGCTLPAARAVCDVSLDDVASLVDKSLLRRAPTSHGDRYWMLETIRTVAADARDASRTDELRSRLGAWLLAQVEDLGSDDDLTGGPHVGAESDNVRSVIVDSVAAGDRVLAARLLCATERYWIFGGRVREGSALADAVVLADGELDDADEAALASTAAELARYRSDFGAAAPMKRRAAELYERLGDDANLAATLADLADTLAVSGDRIGALDAAERSLAIRRRLGDPAGIAHAIHAFTTIAEIDGDYGRAIACHREALERAHEGDQAWLVDFLELGLAADLAFAGETAESLDPLEHWLQLHPEPASDPLIVLLETLAWVCVRDGAPERAASLLGAADAVHSSSGIGRDPALWASRTEQEARRSLGHAAFDAAADRFVTCSQAEATALVRQTMVEL